MLSKNINFKPFKIKLKNGKIRKDLNFLINENNQVVKSLTKYYKNNFEKKDLLKYKKYSNFRIIGMGGSSLGAQAIYDFLKHKIKL